MTLNRIAYILKIFPKLSETFIANELAQLRRCGIDVRIFSLLPPKESLRHELVRRDRLEEVACYQPAEFRSLLRAFKPDLLHAHFATEPTAAARELGTELGVPFTFTAHGYDIRRKPPADFGARAASAAAVITVSEANRQAIHEKFGVPAERIHVIACGVDTELFRSKSQPPSPAERINPTPARKRPLIVCVARLVKVKNLTLLLEACAALRERGREFGCVIVGEGPCRQELEEARRRLGLEELVELPGAAVQGEIVQWWQRATLAVLTSESEGMPVSLMEAAACGVPAVATAVGGIPELVADGVTGLLTPPGNPQLLADALERLLSDPTLAARLGAAARHRVQRYFSLTRQVDRLLALWSGTLHGRGCQ